MHLNLPKYKLTIKKVGVNSFQVFDALRRKYVALTPEEWVRQNFVLYLINEKSFPAGLMANEVSLNQNGISRRCDTLVSNKYGNPFVIIEYKASSIDITQKVFDQIVRYNMVMRAEYLIVSNGISHYCCHIDYINDSYEFMPSIPHYSEL